MHIQPDDHIAIMAVITRETDMFVARDFVGWAACWVQDERTCDVCISSSFGATVLEGWDKLGSYMQSVMEAGMACQIADFQRIDPKITISGDIAHVIFDGRSIHLDGRVEDTFETRTMERSNGTWQILYASFVLRGHQQVDANRLAVDADGRVPCAPNAALNLLVGHDCLQISAGRLRATTPAWDKTLQAAIQSAAAQHGYFQHYRYTTEHGRNFRLPVVLGEKDEGGVAVCVLFVRDGVTFVETQNDGDLDARLTIAKAIFGLSDGQMQLAKRIVNGDGLIAAAAVLGITINTAKTHLSRIYVKTGVNAQTALVRSLLSVG